MLETNIRMILKTIICIIKNLINSIGCNLNYICVYSVMPFRNGKGIQSRFKTCTKSTLPVSSERPRMHTKLEFDLIDFPENNPCNLIYNNEIRYPHTKKPGTKRSTSQQCKLSFPAQITDYIIRNSR